MARWGCPEAIRVDNGSPWGTQTDLPSALALWWVGLGILPIYGRPARSTDNALVERCHGVLAQWVCPAQCADRGTCQQQLDWAVQTQRERYRDPHGYTRAQTYPQLETNPRRYRAAAEPVLWRLERVRAYLAQRAFRRKVERNGTFTLFANRYALGSAYARQYVSVQLEPDADQWVCYSDDGTRLRCHPTRELTYEHITQFRLAKRRKSG